MTDYRSRVFIGFLAVGLVGVALVNMVVDRRALSEGGGGSIGIIGAARAGLLVGKDPTDPGKFHSRTQ